MSMGYVYVLSNPAMPGVVKIGRATHGATARAKALHTTAVPSAFVVEFEILCLDAELAEDRAHRRANRARVATRREFFRLSVRDAVCIVIDAARVDWERLGDCQPRYWMPDVPVSMSPEEQESAHRRGLAHLAAIRKALSEDVSEVPHD